MSIENVGQGQKVLISAYCHNCFELYKSLCDGLCAVTPQRALDIGFDRNASYDFIQDARSRFKAWAVNIAALQGAHLQSSLESRLKEAPEIRQRILKILDSLAQSLREASMIVDGSKPNEKWEDGAISDSDEDDASTPGETTQTSDLEQLFTAIKTANSSLMKLSMVIRNSPARDDYLKAASRYPFDAKYDIGHVREKHGPAKQSSGWLLERLGKAITRRRQYLKYREEHHAKLSREWENATVEETATIGGDIDVPPISIANAAEDKTPEKTIALTKVTKATTYVENKSMIERDGIDLDQGSFGSQTSYEPTVIGEAVHKLSIPPPPTMAFEDILFEFGEPFQCPYCYMEVTVKNKTAWKKHVFRDLKPYVCTFRECNLKMFRSRNEWFAHEIQSHRREWCCIACPENFTEKAKFSRHLESKHYTLVAESQLEALVLQCEEPVDKIPASACPLCDEWETNLMDPKQDLKRLFLNNGEVVEPCGTLNQFRRHLGHHMEQLALFALPMAEDDEMEDDSVEESSDDGDLNEEKHVLPGRKDKMPAETSDPDYDPLVEPNHRSIIDRIIEGFSMQVGPTPDTYPQLLAHPDSYLYLQRAVLKLSDSNQARINEDIAFILDSTILIENIGPDLKEKEILDLMNKLALAAPKTLILEHDTSHTPSDSRAAAAAEIPRIKKIPLASKWDEHIDRAAKYMQAARRKGGTEDEKAEAIEQIPREGQVPKSKSSVGLGATRAFARFLTVIGAKSAALSLNGFLIGGRSLQVKTLRVLVATFNMGPLEDEKRSELTDLPVDKVSINEKGEADDEEISAMKRSLAELEDEVAIPVKPHEMRQDVINSRSIFVANLGDVASLEELSTSVRAYFGTCGVINGVTFLVNKFSSRPNGQAYVEFAAPESATQALAMNESVFNGRILQVLPKEAVSQDAVSRTSASKVAVGNAINLEGFGGEVEANDGIVVTLEELVDYSRNGIIIFTYAKASGPEATTEACLFRDHHDLITEHGFSVFGLSNDTTTANRIFRERCSLPYLLLSDPLSSLISAIGMQKFQFGTIPGVFIVDKSGKVLEATPCPPTESLDIVKKVIGAFPANVTTAPTSQDATAARIETADETMLANTSLDEPRNRKGSEGGMRPLTTSPPKAGLSEVDFDTMALILQRISEYRDYRDDKNDRILSHVLMLAPYKDPSSDLTKVAKFPLVLEDISEKITKRQYATFKDFVWDFSWICHNVAQRFNSSSSQVYQDVISLRELFKAELKKLVDDNTISSTDANLPDLGGLHTHESEIENHPIQIQPYSAAVGAAIGTETSHQAESTSAMLDMNDADVGEQATDPGWLRTSIVHLLAVGELSEVELRRKLAMQETYDGSDLQLALKQTLKEVALAKSHGPPAENKLKWHLRPDVYRELDIWKFAYSDADERKRAIDNATNQYRQLNVGPDDPEWTRLLPEAERAPIKFLKTKNKKVSPRAQSLSFMEIQDDEITALSAAYGRNFRRWAPTLDQGWKRFEIRISSSSQEGFTLRVTLPATYPMTEPQLTLHNFSGIGEETRQKVLKMLDTQLELMRSNEDEQPMIMELANACSDILEHAAQDKAAGKEPVDAIPGTGKVGMGSFVFMWEHPASEVYVTGTFDNWSKSEKLARVGDTFEKKVSLPIEKTYYKFVVDGNWVTNHTAPQERDDSGNLNNYLTAKMIAAGTWNSSTIAKASSAEESKDNGRGDTRILASNSPPRPIEQSNQASETYSREDILSIDRAQPTVTIDPDSNLYSVIIRNLPMSMFKDDLEQGMQVENINFIAVEVLPPIISEELGLGSNSAILRFASHTAAARAEMYFNQLNIHQMKVEVLHGWTMSKLAASTQLQHSIRREDAETEEHKNETDEDGDDSDVEIQKVGVELNERLRAAVAVALREADSSAAVMDEEWEQWLKDAVEAGGIPSVSSNASPNNLGQPREQSLLLSTNATMEIEENVNKPGHALNDVEAAPRIQNTPRYVTERTRVIKSLSSFAKENQHRFNFASLSISGEEIDVIDFLIAVRALGGYYTVTAQRNWAAVADALLINVMKLPNAPEHLQWRYEQTLLEAEKWLSQDSGDKHEDKISRAMTSLSKHQTSRPQSPIPVAPVRIPSPKEPEIPESHARRKSFDSRPLEEWISMASTGNGLLAPEDSISDFCNVLGIPANYDSLTQCVGLTKKGTRCRWRHSKEVSEEILSLINARVRLGPEPSEVSTILPFMQNLARLWLCNTYHQEQASDLVNRWMASIDNSSPESMRRAIAADINGAGSTIEHAPAKQ